MVMTLSFEGYNFGNEEHAPCHFNWVEGAHFVLGPELWVCQNDVIAGFGSWINFVLAALESWGYYRQQNLLFVSPTIFVLQGVQALPFESQQEHSLNDHFPRRAFSWVKAGFKLLPIFSACYQEHLEWLSSLPTPLISLPSTREQAPGWICCS